MAPPPPGPFFHYPSGVVFPPPSPPMASGGSGGGIPSPSEIHRSETPNATLQLLDECYGSEGEPSTSRSRDDFVPPLSSLSEYFGPAQAPTLLLSECYDPQPEDESSPAAAPAPTTNKEQSYLPLTQTLPLPDRRRLTPLSPISERSEPSSVPTPSIYDAYLGDDEPPATIPREIEAPLLPPLPPQSEYAGPDTADALLDECFTLLGESTSHVVDHYLQPSVAGSLPPSLLPPARTQPTTPVPDEGAEPTPKPRGGFERAGEPSTPRTATPATPSEPTTPTPPAPSQPVTPPAPSQPCPPTLGPCCHPWSSAPAQQETFESSGCLSPSSDCLEGPASAPAAGSDFWIMVTRGVDRCMHSRRPFSLPRDRPMSPEKPAFVMRTLAQLPELKSVPRGQAVPHAPPSATSVHGQLGDTSMLAYLDMSDRASRAIPQDLFDDYYRSSRRLSNVSICSTCGGYDGIDEEATPRALPPIQELGNVPNKDAPTARDLPVSFIPPATTPDTSRAPPPRPPRPPTHLTIDTDLARRGRKPVTEAVQTQALDTGARELNNVAESPTVHTPLPPCEPGKPQTLQPGPDSPAVCTPLPDGDEVCDFSNVQCEPCESPIAEMPTACVPAELHACEPVECEIPDAPSPPRHCTDVPQSACQSPEFQVPCGPVPEAAEPAEPCDCGECEVPPAKDPESPIVSTPPPLGDCTRDLGSPAADGASFLNGPVPELPGKCDGGEVMEMADCASNVSSPIVPTPHACGAHNCQQASPTGGGLGAVATPPETPKTGANVPGVISPTPSLPTPIREAEEAAALAAADAKANGEGKKEDDDEVVELANVAEDEAESGDEEGDKPPATGVTNAAKEDGDESDDEQANVVVPPSPKLPPKSPEAGEAAAAAAGQGEDGGESSSEEEGEGESDSEEEGEGPDTAAGAAGGAGEGATAQAGANADSAGAAAGANSSDPAAGAEPGSAPAGAAAGGATGAGGGDAPANPDDVMSQYPNAPQRPDELEEVSTALTLGPHAPGSPQLAAQPQLPAVPAGQGAGAAAGGDALNDVPDNVPGAGPASGQGEELGAGPGAGPDVVGVGSLSESEEQQVPVQSFPDVQDQVSPQAALPTSPPPAAAPQEFATAVPSTRAPTARPQAPVAPQQQAPPYQPQPQPQPQPHLQQYAGSDYTSSDEDEYDPGYEQGGHTYDNQSLYDEASAQPTAQLPAAVVRPQPAYQSPVVNDTSGWEQAPAAYVQPQYAMPSSQPVASRPAMSMAQADAYGSVYGSDVGSPIYAAQPTQQNVDDVGYANATAGDTARIQAAAQQAGNLVAAQLGVPRQEAARQNAATAQAQGANETGGQHRGTRDVDSDSEFDSDSIYPTYVSPEDAAKAGGKQQGKEQKPGANKDRAVKRGDVAEGSVSDGTSHVSGSSFDLEIEMTDDEDDGQKGGKRGGKRSRRRGQTSRQRDRGDGFVRDDTGRILSPPGKIVEGEARKYYDGRPGDQGKGLQGSYWSSEPGEWGLPRSPTAREMHIGPDYESEHEDPDEDDEEGANDNVAQTTAGIGALGLKDVTQPEQPTLVQGRPTDYLGVAPQLAGQPQLTANNAAQGATSHGERGIDAHAHGEPAAGTHQHGGPHLIPDEDEVSSIWSSDEDDAAQGNNQQPLNVLGNVADAQSDYLLSPGPAANDDLLPPGQDRLSPGPRADDILAGPSGTRHENEDDQFVADASSNAVAGPSGTRDSITGVSNETRPGAPAGTLPGGDHLIRVNSSQFGSEFDSMSSPMAPGIEDLGPVGATTTAPSHTVADAHTDDIGHTRTTDLSAAEPAAPSCAEQPTRDDTATVGGHPHSAEQHDTTTVGGHPHSAEQHDTTTVGGRPRSAEQHDTTTVSSRPHSAEQHNDTMAVGGRPHSAEQHDTATVGGRPHSAEQHDTTTVSGRPHSAEQHDDTMAVGGRPHSAEQHDTTTVGDRPRSAEQHDDTTNIGGRPHSAEQHDTTTVSGRPCSAEQHDGTTTVGGRPHSAEQHDGTTTVGGRPRSAEQHDGTTTVGGRPHSPPIGATRLEPASPSSSHSTMSLLDDASRARRATPQGTTGGAEDGIQEAGVTNEAGPSGNVLGLTIGDPAGSGSNSPPQTALSPGGPREPLSPTQPRDALSPGAPQNAASPGRPHSPPSASHPAVPEHAHGGSATGQTEENRATTSPVVPGNLLEYHDRTATSPTTPGEHASGSPEVATHAPTHPTAQGIPHPPAPGIPHRPPPLALRHDVDVETLPSASSASSSIRGSPRRYGGRLALDQRPHSGVVIEPESPVDSRRLLDAAPSHEDGAHRSPEPTSTGSHRPLAQHSHNGAVVEPGTPVGTRRLLDAGTAPSSPEAEHHRSLVRRSTGSRRSSTGSHRHSLGAEHFYDDIYIGPDSPVDTGRLSEAGTATSSPEDGSHRRPLDVGQHPHNGVVIEPESPIGTRRLLGAGSVPSSPEVSPRSPHRRSTRSHRRLSTDPRPLAPDQYPHNGVVIEPESPLATQRLLDADSVLSSPEGSLRSSHRRSGSHRSLSTDPNHRPLAADQYPHNGVVVEPESPVATRRLLDAGTASSSPEEGTYHVVRRRSTESQLGSSPDRHRRPLAVDQYPHSGVVIEPESPVGTRRLLNAGSAPSSPEDDSYAVARRRSTGPHRASPTDPHRRLAVDQYPHNGVVIEPESRVRTHHLLDAGSVPSSPEEISHQVVRRRSTESRRGSPTDPHRPLAVDQYSHNGVVIEPDSPPVATRRLLDAASTGAFSPEQGSHQVVHRRSTGSHRSSSPDRHHRLDQYPHNGVVIEPESPVRTHRLLDAAGIAPSSPEEGSHQVVRRRSWEHRRLSTESPLAVDQYPHNGVVIEPESPVRTRRLLDAANTAPSSPEEGSYHVARRRSTGSPTGSQYQPLAVDQYPHYDVVIEPESPVTTHLALEASASSSQDVELRRADSRGRPLAVDRYPHNGVVIEPDSPDDIRGSPRLIGSPRERLALDQYPHNEDPRREPLALGAGTTPSGPAGPDVNSWPHPTTLNTFPGHSRRPIDIAPLSPYDSDDGTDRLALTRHGLRGSAGSLLAGTATRGTESPTTATHQPFTTLGNVASNDRSGVGLTPLSSTSSFWDESLHEGLERFHHAVPSRDSHNGRDVKHVGAKTHSADPHETNSTSQAAPQAHRESVRSPSSSTGSDSPDFEEAHAQWRHYVRARDGPSLSRVSSSSSLSAAEPLPLPALGQPVRADSHRVHDSHDATASGPQQVHAESSRHATTSTLPPHAVRGADHDTDAHGTKRVRSRPPSLELHRDAGPPSGVPSTVVSTALIGPHADRPHVPSHEDVGRAPADDGASTASSSGSFATAILSPDLHYGLTLPPAIHSDLHGPQSTHPHGATQGHGATHGASTHVHDAAHRQEAVHGHGAAFTHAHHASTTAPSPYDTIVLANAAPSLPRTTQQEPVSPDDTPTTGSRVYSSTAAPDATHTPPLPSTTQHGAHTTVPELTPHRDPTHPTTNLSNVSSVAESVRGTVAHSHADASHHGLARRHAPASDVPMSASSYTSMDSDDAYDGYRHERESEGPSASAHAHPVPADQAVHGTTDRANVRYSDILLNAEHDSLLAKIPHSPQPSSITADAPHGGSQHVTSLHVHPAPLESHPPSRQPITHTLPAVNAHAQYTTPERPTSTSSDGSWISSDGSYTDSSASWTPGPRVDSPVTAHPVSRPAASQVSANTVPPSTTSHPLPHGNERHEHHDATTVHAQSHTSHAAPTPVAPALHSHTNEARRPRALSLLAMEIAARSDPFADPDTPVDYSPGLTPTSSMYSPQHLATFHGRRDDPREYHDNRAVASRRSSASSMRTVRPPAQVTRHDTHLPMGHHATRQGTDNSTHHDPAIDPHPPGHADTRVTPARAASPGPSYSPKTQPITVSNVTADDDWTPSPRRAWRDPMSPDATQTPDTAFGPSTMMAADYLNQHSPPPREWVPVPAPAEPEPTPAPPSQPATKRQYVNPRHLELYEAKKRTDEEQAAAAKKKAAEERKGAEKEAAEQKTVEVSGQPEDSVHHAATLDNEPSSSVPAAVVPAQERPTQQTFNGSTAHDHGHTTRRTNSRSSTPTAQTFVADSSAHGHAHGPTHGQAHHDDAHVYSDAASSLPMTPYSPASLRPQSPPPPPPPVHPHAPAQQPPAATSTHTPQRPQRPLSPQDLSDANVTTLSPTSSSPSFSPSVPPQRYLPHPQPRPADGPAHVPALPHRAPESPLSPMPGLGHHAPLGKPGSSDDVNRQTHHQPTTRAVRRSLSWDPAPVRPGSVYRSPSLLSPSLRSPDSRVLDHAWPHTTSPVPASPPLVKSEQLETHPSEAPVTSSQNVPSSLALDSHPAPAQQHAQQPSEGNQDSPKGGRLKGIMHGLQFDRKQLMESIRQRTRKGQGKQVSHGGAEPTGDHQRRRRSSLPASLKNASVTQPPFAEPQLDRPSTPVSAHNAGGAGARPLPPRDSIDEPLSALPNLGPAPLPPQTKRHSRPLPELPPPLPPKDHRAPSKRPPSLHSLHNLPPSKRSSSPSFISPLPNLGPSTVSHAHAPLQTHRRPSRGSHDYHTPAGGSSDPDSITPISFDDRQEHFGPSPHVDRHHQAAPISPLPNLGSAPAPHDQRAHVHQAHTTTTRHEPPRRQPSVDDTHARSHHDKHLPPVRHDSREAPEETRKQKPPPLNLSNVQHHGSPARSPDYRLSPPGQPVALPEDTASKHLERNVRHAPSHSHSHHPPPRPQHEPSISTLTPSPIVRGFATPPPRSASASPVSTEWHSSSPTPQRPRTHPTPYQPSPPPGPRDHLPLSNEQVRAHDAHRDEHASGPTRQHSQARDDHSQGHSQQHDTRQHGSHLHTQHGAQRADHTDSSRHPRDPPGDHPREHHRGHENSQQHHSGRHDNTQSDDHTPGSVTHHNVPHKNERKGPARPPIPHSQNESQEKLAYPPLSPTYSPPLSPARTKYDDAPGPSQDSGHAPSHGPGHGLSHGPGYAPGQPHDAAAPSPKRGGLFKRLRAKIADLGQEPVSPTSGTHQVTGAPTAPHVGPSKPEDVLAAPPVGWGTTTHGPVAGRTVPPPLRAPPPMVVAHTIPSRSSLPHPSPKGYDVASLYSENVHDAPGIKTSANQEPTPTHPPPVANRKHDAHHDTVRHADSTARPVHDTATSHAPHPRRDHDTATGYPSHSIAPTHTVHNVPAPGVPANKKPSWTERVKQKLRDAGEALQSGEEKESHTAAPQASSHTAANAAPPHAAASRPTESHSDAPITVYTVASSAAPGASHHQAPTNKRPGVWARLTADPDSRPGTDDHHGAKHNAAASHQQPAPTESLLQRIIGAVTSEPGSKAGAKNDGHAHDTGVDDQHGKEHHSNDPHGNNRHHDARADRHHDPDADRRHNAHSNRHLDAAAHSHHDAAASHPQPAPPKSRLQRFLGVLGEDPGTVRVTKAGKDNHGKHDADAPNKQLVLANKKSEGWWAGRLGALWMSPDGDGSTGRQQEPTRLHYARILVPPMDKKPDNDDSKWLPKAPWRSRGDQPDSHARHAHGSAHAEASANAVVVHNVSRVHGSTSRSGDSRWDKFWNSFTADNATHEDATHAIPPGQNHRHRDRCGVSWNQLWASMSEEPRDDGAPRERWYHNMRPSNQLTLPRFNGIRRRTHGARERCLPCRFSVSDAWRNRTRGQKRWLKALACCFFLFLLILGTVPIALILKNKFSSPPSNHNKRSIEPWTNPQSLNDCLVQFTGLWSYPCGACMPLLRERANDFTPIAGTTASAGAIQQFCALKDIADAAPNHMSDANWGLGMPCSGQGWAGVTCDSTGRVTGLELVYPNVPSVLPTTFKDLSFLSALIISGNSQLPGGQLDLDSFTLLSSIDIERTALRGTVRATPSLADLILVANPALSLDADLAQATGLTQLTVSGGQLSHFPTLPTSITYLDLSSNSLSGAVPNFEDQPGLTTIYLQQNAFTAGPKNLPSGLQALSLANNPGLAGAMPSGVCASNVLTSCDLRGTRLGNPTTSPACGPCKF